jgi:hypothetical protein
MKYAYKNKDNRKTIRKVSTRRRKSKQYIYLRNKNSFLRKLKYFFLSIYHLIVSLVNL